MRKLLPAALLLGTAYVGYGPVMAAAPDVARFVERTVRALTGYTTEACRADPAGCLESRRVALDHSKEQIEKAIAELQVQIGTVAGIAGDNDLLLAKNVAFLDQGKAVLKGAASPGQRLEFAGLTYPDAATLRSQLETLFGENQMLRAAVDRAHDLRSKLEGRLQQLRGQHGSVLAAIAILPSQISLVQADASLTDLSGTLGLIDTALKTSDQDVGAANDLIGTTAELAKRSEEASGLTPRQREISEAFDRFLAQ